MTESSTTELHCAVLVVLKANNTHELGRTLKWTSGRRFFTMAVVCIKALDNASSSAWYRIRAFHAAVSASKRSIDESLDGLAAGAFTLHFQRNC